MYCKFPMLGNIYNEHGSHIFRLTNFPDFSRIFSIFQYFLVFYFMNLTNTKIYFSKYTSIKNSEKK